MDRCKGLFVFHTPFVREIVSCLCVRRGVGRGGEKLLFCTTTFRLCGASGLHYFEGPVVTITEFAVFQCGERSMLKIRDGLPVLYLKMRSKHRFLVWKFDITLLAFRVKGAGLAAVTVSIFRSLWRIISRLIALDR